jgi:hypothetical protein
MSCCRSKTAQQPQEEAFIGGGTYSRDRLLCVGLCGAISVHQRKKNLVLRLYSLRGLAPAGEAVVFVDEESRSDVVLQIPRQASR